MTRYDDRDESGGGISVSGRAPGPPRPTASDSRGDTDWELALYGPAPDEHPDPRAGRAGGDGRDDAGQDGGRPRWRRPSRHALLGGAAIIAMFAVVATSLAAYAKYRGVVGSIHRENVTAAMLGKRPPYTAGLNILIIGSDSRQGLGRKFGADVLGARSDTSMLLHIAPGHTRADIISFPRDSMVPVLACADDKQGHPGQSAQPGQVERLNATFSAGGAPCLWKTLEQETGIRIQHFLEVNFAGFQSIVNDVGGVPVCLPFAINNPQARLHLAAGKRVVNGAQALAFVRLRENVGEGSDTQRIQRQQYFLAAVMQKLKSTNLLSQPSRIFNVVRDVAKSLTTDTGLDLTTMLRIADSMKSLSSSSVQLVTVPVVPYAGDPAAELSWEQPQADRMFRAVEADRDLPAAAKGTGKSKARTAKIATAEPTVSPAKVSVQVLNGSGVNGVAGTAATALTAKGFTVTGTGPAANYSYTSSVIQYSSAAQLPEVNTLKAELGSVVLQKDTALGTGSINLILGSSYQGLGPGKGAAKSSAKTLSNLAKSYGGITANANICKDSAAFAGPDTPLPGG
ncbi:MAG TPA: LCP family protein [Streptosporangiaceae bacterium]|nr:LCP family protein [Streptosporangiaceae bacterium]